MGIEISVKALMRLVSSYDLTVYLTYLMPIPVWTKRRGGTADSRVEAPNYTEPAMLRVSSTNQKTAPISFEPFSNRGSGVRFRLFRSLFLISLSVSLPRFPSGSSVSYYLSFYTLFTNYHINFILRAEPRFYLIFYMDVRSLRLFHFLELPFFRIWNTLYEHKNERDTKFLLLEMFDFKIS